MMPTNKFIGYQKSNLLKQVQPLAARIINQMERSERKDTLKPKLISPVGVVLVGIFNVFARLKGAWILSLVIGALALGGCDGLVQTASYASYAEAEADGFVQKGWIPDFVPETAGQIDEAHDLDTNQYCARIALGGYDIERLYADLAAEEFRQYEGELPVLALPNKPKA